MSIPSELALAEKNMTTTAGYDLKQLAEMRVSEQQAEQKKKAEPDTKPCPLPEMEYPEIAYSYLKEVLEERRTFDLKTHGKYLVFSTLRHVRKPIAAKFNFAELIIQLLERGLDPNMEDENGESLLSLAVTSHSLPLVQYLVSKKVPLNTLCRATGRGIIHYLVHFSYGNENEILEFLLKAGLDPNLPDANGTHPLGYLIDHLFSAEQMKKKAKILLRYGLEVNHVNPKGHTVLDYGDDNIDFGWKPDIIPTLKCLFANANVTHMVNPRSGATAFHKAAKYGFYDMLMFLAGNTPEADLKIIREAASQAMINIGKISTQKEYQVFGAWPMINHFAEDKHHKEMMDMAHDQVKGVISLLAQLGASTQSIETAHKNCEAQLKQLRKNFAKLDDEFQIKLKTGKAKVSEKFDCRGLESLKFQMNNLRVQMEFIKYIQDNLTSALHFSQYCTEQQIHTMHLRCFVSNLKWKLQEATGQNSEDHSSAKIVLLSAEACEARGIKKSSPVTTSISGSQVISPKGN